MRYSPPPLLRDYQRWAVDRLIEKINCRSHPILVSPTGSGKTVMLTNLCRRLGANVLWVAHRRELISQAEAHLNRIGFENYYATSVQKQARRPIPSGVGLIVIDECHHAIRDSQYQKLFDTGMPIVGATATPFRKDGRGLGDMFGSLVVAAYPAELAKLGFIQAPKIFSHDAPDMDGANKVGGDWSLKDLGERSNKPKLIANIYDTWIKRAAGLRTLAFASTIEHSKTIISQFTDNGISAEHLDGSTPKNDRDAILARLRAGKTLIVSNVGVATEGFDMPALDCAIIARPTASLCLWLQMCGRIMRPEGSAIILDHSGNALRHGSPIRPIEYSLATDNKQKQERLDLKLCPNCLLMVRRGAWKCPDCGFDLSPVAAVKMKIAAGELVEFEDKLAVWGQIDGDKIRYRGLFGEEPVIVDGELVPPTEYNKRKVYEDLCEIAWSRNYKMGWARVQYKRIFGRNPSGSMSDIITNFMNKKYKV